MNGLNLWKAGMIDNFEAALRRKKELSEDFN